MNRRRKGFRWHWDNARVLWLAWRDRRRNGVRL